MKVRVGTSLRAQALQPLELVEQVLLGIVLIRLLFKTATQKIHNEHGINMCNDTK